MWLILFHYNLVHSPIVAFLGPACSVVVISVEQNGPTVSWKVFGETNIKHSMQISIVENDAGCLEMFLLNHNELNFLRNE